MDIYFYGLTSVRIKGKRTTLLIDPFTKEKAGIPFAKLSADAVLLTSKDNSTTSIDQVYDFRAIIDGTGEYEVGGASIIGMKLQSTTTYFIKIDSITLLHLATLHQTPSDSELKEYPNIDILFVSAQKEAPDVIAKLEPKVVVPMNFTSETLAFFLKELGKEGINPQSKLTISKEKMPGEVEIVVLE